MKNPNKKKRIRLRAYAKINLGLIIKGKRSDGYHDIETIFLPVELYDRIIIEKSHNDIIIECNDPSIPTDNTNFTYIAFRKLKERYPLKIKGGIKIYIEKNIPAGSGLGGGSSDAGSVLLGIRKLWDIGISDELLKDIALEIGSDVPFFIDCVPALASGRGEILKRVDYDIRRWILLIYPNINISTSWAYKSFNFVLTNKVKNINLSKLIKKNIFKFKDFLQNDLETLVFSQYPQLAEIKDELYKAGAEFALMSGSGSCVYGLFEEKDIAIKSKDRLKEFGNVYITRQVLTPKIFI
ncbi:4-(cytidine 5'-diphospho)-2-C-methyl-D-erythritol kinase [candidate division KSB1 bacterium]